MGVKVSTLIRGKTGKHIRYFHIKWIGGETVVAIKHGTTKESVDWMMDRWSYLESIREITRYRYNKKRDDM